MDDPTIEFDDAALDSEFDQALETQEAPQEPAAPKTAPVSKYDEDLSAEFDVAESYQDNPGPIDIREIMGLTQVSNADIVAAERLAGTPRNAKAVLSELDEKDAPWVGVGFQMSHIYDLKEAELAVKNGTATLEQERMLLFAFAEAARQGTTGGVAAQTAASLVSTGLEMFGGYGLATAGTKYGVKAATRVFGEQFMRDMRRRAIKTFGRANYRLAQKVGQGAAWTAATAGVQEGGARYADEIGVGSGAGYWKAVEARRVLEDLDIEGDPEAAALILNENQDKFIEGLDQFGAGLAEVLVTNAIEQTGALLTKIPVVSHLKAAETMVLRRVAKALGTGIGPAKRNFHKLFDKAAIAGGVGELSEEWSQGVTTDALFGSGDPFQSLPDEFHEALGMYIGMAFPGAAGVAKAAMFERVRQQYKAEVQAKAQEMLGEGTETATEGGDSVSSGEATAETAEAEPDVSVTPEMRAEDAADYSASVNEELKRKHEGEEPYVPVEFVPEAPTSEADLRVLENSRRKGIEPTFVRAPEGFDMTGVAPAAFLGDGRIVIVKDSPAARSLEKHEQIHLWAEQQGRTKAERDVAVAELMQELNEIHEEFEAEFGEIWEQFTSVDALEAAPELKAEETIATAAQLLDPLMEFVKTPDGALALEKVRRERPGRFRRVMNFIYDWIADNIPALPRRAQVRARELVDSVRGDAPMEIFEVAERLNKTLDSIEAVQRRPPTQEQVDEMKARTPAPKRKAPRQKKKRGGKRAEKKRQQEKADQRERKRARSDAGTKDGMTGRGEVADLSGVEALQSPEFEPRTDAGGTVAQRRADAKFAPAPPVDSPAFRRWFGDSKVVDADGNPLVMYHGTTSHAKFTAFKGDQFGISYFTPDPYLADDFTGVNAGFFEDEGLPYDPVNPTRFDRGGPRAYPVYISAQKVFDWRNKQHLMLLRRELERRFPDDHILQPAFWSEIQKGDWDAYETESVVDVLKNQGYDAVRMVEMDIDSLAVFDAAGNVKSATGNRGTFDPANPDIRFAPAAPVDSPAFRRWFGDSKVVDESGAPLVVYHGTGAGFAAFDPDRGDLGFHFGDASQAELRLRDVETKDFGLSRGAARLLDGQRVLPVYLSVQNPLRMRDAGNWGNAVDVLEALWDSEVASKFPRRVWEEVIEERNSFEYAPDYDTSPENEAALGDLRSELEKLGYDGVVYANVAEVRFGESAQAYIAFRPEQVKSATGNRGTFDPTNPDIRFAPAIPLREGGPIKLDRKGRIQVGDVARVLNAKKRRDYKNPRVFRAVVKDVAAEFAYQMEQHRTGADWYDADIGQAFRLMSEVHPELANDEHARVLFTAMVAVTSNGQRAGRNWMNAALIYDEWKRTGNIPRVNPTNGMLWGNKGQTIAAGLGVLQHMLDTMGIEETNRFLLGKATVDEVRAIRRGAAENESIRTKMTLPTGKALKNDGMLKASQSMGVSGKKTDEVVGARVFGPKVGPFMLNVNNMNETTVDMWAMRTFGRHFGTLFEGQLADTGIHDAPTDAERPYAKRLFEEVGKIHGVESHVAQAVLWFFEQQTYYAMGAKSARSEFFSDGARQFLEQQGIDVEEAESRARRGAPATAADIGVTDVAASAQEAGEVERFALPNDPKTVAMWRESGFAPPGRLTQSFTDAAVISSRTDRFLRRFSDKELVIPRWLNALRRGVNDFEEGAQVEETLRLRPGREAAKTQRLKKLHRRAVRLMSKKKGFDISVGREGDTIADGKPNIGEYVEVRHVPEANQRFADLYKESVAERAVITRMKRQLRGLDRNQKVEDEIRQLESRWQKRYGFLPRVPKGQDVDYFFNEVYKPAGLGSDEARMLEAKYLAEPNAEGYRRLARIHDALVRDTADYQLEAQLISAETHQQWREMFDHYAPLRSEEVDGPQYTLGRGYDTKGPEVKRRKGRSTRAANPFVMNFEQALNAYRRGENNRVGRAVRQLLLDNASLIPFEEREAEMKKDGSWDLSPTEFHMKVHGEDVAVDLMNEDLARALKLTDVPSIPAVVRWMFINPMNLFRAAVTQYSPDFIFRNFFRDAFTGQINALELGEELDLEGLQKDMMKFMPTAVRTGYRYRRGKATLEPRLRRMYEMYLDNGGEMGMWGSPLFQQQLKSFEFGKTVQDHASLRGAAHVGRWVSDANLAVEHAARFALFAKLVERGVNVKRAAREAKRLTVDFSQRGEWGQVASTIWAFFSASVGGTRRGVEALLRSKRAKQVTGAIFMHGLIQSLVMEAISDEDDEDKLSKYSKLPDYVKEMNAVLWMVGDNPVMVPLPYFYGWFHNVGRLAGEYAQGLISEKEALSSLGRSAITNFSPIGGGATISQTLAPTILQPWLQVKENKAFHGGPIRPQDNPWGPEVARWQMETRGTTEVGKQIARGLNYATGGFAGDNRIDPGQLNLAGDDVDHFAEFFLGGPMRTFNNLMRSGRSLASGQAPEPASIPVGRVFFGARTEFTDSGNFYEGIDDIARTKELITRLENQGDKEDARRVKRQSRGLLALEKSGREAMRRVKKLRDAAYLGYGAYDAEKMDRAGQIMRRWYRRYLDTVAELNSRE